MTGIQVILAFSTVIILVALGLLIWGREQGTGTIKIFGMELTTICSCSYLKPSAHRDQE